MDVREADTRLAIIDIASVLLLMVVEVVEGKKSSADDVDTDDILMLPWGGDITQTGASR